ncbi:MAG: hypothetical protein LBJ42_01580 [Holosporales bacterium]|jgi:hypothetical protein|nr:hypothetical protein [Holosporales bacterium]
MKIFNVAAAVTMLGMIGMSELQAAAGANSRRARRYTFCLVPGLFSTVSAPAPAHEKRGGKSAIFNPNPNATALAPVGARVPPPPRHNPLGSAFFECRDIEDLRQNERFKGINEIIHAALGRPFTANDSRWIVDLAVDPLAWRSKHEYSPRIKKTIEEAEIRVMAYERAVAGFRERLANEHRLLLAKIKAHKMRAVAPAIIMCEGKSRRDSYGKTNGDAIRAGWSIAGQIYITHIAELVDKVEDFGLDGALADYVNRIDVPARVADVAAAIRSNADKEANRIRAERALMIYLAHYVKPILPLLLRIKIAIDRAMCGNPEFDQ